MIDPMLSIWYLSNILRCVYGSLYVILELGDFLIIRQKVQQMIKRMQGKVERRLWVEPILILCRTYPWIQNIYVMLTECTQCQMM